MKVFDIIEIVRPGALTSLKVGERWSESRDSQKEAESAVEIFNMYAAEGVSYYVEEIEESDENRKLP